jgi:WD domain, G-beta repeat
MLRRLVGLPGGLRQAAFSPDGRTIAAAGVNRKVQLWDSATGATLGSFPVALVEVRSLAFAPYGKTLALGGDFKDQCIALHELPTGKELRRLLGHTYAVSSVDFVPDGKLLVSASPDRTMRLWDVDSGKELRRIDVTPYQALGGFNGMALSADGRFAVSAGKNHQIRIWEVATFQQVRSFTGHEGDVYAVAFAPDGRALASASRDGTILVWDASGRVPDSPKRLGPHELDVAWANLASMDAPTGERAMWALVAAPGQALTLLAQRLRPITRVDAAQLARLVADLGSDRFPVREKATEDLVRLGAAAAPALRKALETEPPLEIRRRVERLLDKLEGTERLRQTRALAALERIGTPEAAQVVEVLAGGVAGAWLTQEARTSLDRLRRRTAAVP